MIKGLEHPLIGTLRFETTTLRVPARPDLTVVRHNPLPDSDTAAKPARLVSPEGRARRRPLASVAECGGGTYPVAG
ncbi:hypothetical protein [Streptomyces sp. NPDC053427]|uniref:MmyB family transcriptional regulator n=1 Tax=Streptomyces sp. NPDC053427 TaxID=3365701 RepID=UPI0037D5B767